MAGSLLQLVAKGPDNLYLDGNPEMSFFRIIYRRHTNFSMYPSYLKFNKTANFGSTVRCRIRPHGDLVTSLVLVIKIPKLIVQYNILTKGILAARLASYSITWSYSGSADDIVTVNDYKQVNTVVNEAIGDENTMGTFLFELDDQNANKNIIIDEYQTGMSNSGVEYANNVFQLLIVNNPLEVLYLYLTAFKNDRVSNSHNIMNFDSLLAYVYNSLVGYIINNDPNFPYIKPNVIFYQSIDLATFYYNSSSTNVKYTFDNAIQNQTDTALDSYIVYNKFFSSTVTAGSQTELDTIENKLLNNIQWNFTKNIQQIINIITLLRYNNSSSDNQFRLGISKILYLISGSQYDGTELMSVVSSQIGNPDLKDQLLTALKVATAPIEPTGVIHYYGNDIVTSGQTLYSGIRASFRTSPVSDYLTDSNIWKTLILSTILGAGYSSLDDVYLLNTIPYYIIDDIPAMVNKYIAESPLYSGYSAYFDLVGSLFANTLKSDIIGMYNSYDPSIKTYITAMNDTFNTGGSDKMLGALFKPELILNIDTSVYTPDVITDANEKNTNLITIEYVITQYAYQYRQLIYNLTSDPSVRTALVSFIITNIVNRYRMTTLPSYTNFQNNGYTLYKIETGSGSSNTSPEFLDAASSVWYILNQQMISSFNTFVYTIVNQVYYQTKLGENMVTALDYFKTLLQGYGLTLDTALDFYRLRLPDAAYLNLITVYTSMLDSANNIFNLYLDQKSILGIRNGSFNTAANYYRRFDDMYDEIVNEFDAHQDIYYPTDYYEPTYMGINIPDTLDAIKANLVSQETVGAIDIFDLSRASLELAITNGNNPFTSGTNLYDWYNTYSGYSMIDSTALDDFDTVMDNSYIPPLPYTNGEKHWLDIINENNTTAQVLDSKVRTNYNSFSSDIDFLAYMTDKVIDNLDKFKKYLPAIETDKTPTYNNFLDIVNAAIASIQTTLDAVYNGEPTATDKYTGSTLDQELYKLVIGGQPPSAWAKELGHYIIEKIHLEIGGQIIDMHVSEWLRLYHKLNIVSQKEDVYKKMIGNVPELYLYDNKQKEQYTMYIPLQFAFCKYISEALPLVALLHTDVDIVLKLRELNQLIKYDTDAYLPKPLNLLDCRILAEYIYVDQDERKRLAEKRHEYIIDTVQSINDSMFGTDNIVGGQFTNRLYFSNPCKLLVWSLKFIDVNSDGSTNINGANNAFDWTNTDLIIDGEVVDPIDSIKIQMNGTTREMDKQSGYYRLVQPNKTGCGTIDGNEFIYSFSLEPLKLQPSGAVNLGLIPDFAIIVTLTDQVAELVFDNKLKVKWSTYNFSYNWLRVISGMGALAFFSAS